jgi:hypothetical protein
VNLVEARKIMQVLIKASQYSNHYPLGLCNSNKGLEVKWYRASVYVEGLVTLS